MDRVKVAFPLAHIAWAWRDEKEQEQAYRDGKSKLRWPHSAHNHTTPEGKPQSLALDLFEITDDNVGRWSPSFFFSVALMIDQDQSPIFWGGKYKHFSDHDHYQMTNPP